MALQGALVIAQQIDLVAHALLHGDDLGIHKGQEAPAGGQLIQYLNFTPDPLCQVFEIFSGSLGVGVRAGEQQCFQLDLGGGDGDGFHNISFIRIRTHGGVAADAAVIGDSAAQCEVIQHGGHESRF